MTLSDVMVNVLNYIHRVKAAIKLIMFFLDIGKVFTSKCH